jgi:acetyl-CoA C-acetyltransferase
MGSTAEIVAKRFGITRTMMDEFAVESHRRVAYAQDNGQLTEVEPMYGPDGKVYAADDGVRRDSQRRAAGQAAAGVRSHLRQRHRRQ